MANYLSQQIYGLPNKAKQIFTAPQPGVFTRLKNAKSMGIDGTLLSLPFVAYGIANAPTGYKGADALSSGISEMVVAPITTAAVYLGLSLILPGIGTGIAAMVLSSGLASPINSFIETRLNRGFRQFRDIDKNLNRLQLGYTDSASAQLYRQTSLRDMSGAFTNSRRFLGREAQVLHR